MYCAELVPKVRFGSSFVTHQLTCLSRCTAPAKGIDDAIYGYRSCGHMTVFVQEFELGVLWDEYGLVWDIEFVSHLLRMSACLSAVAFAHDSTIGLSFIPEAIHAHCTVRIMSDTFSCLGTDP